MRRVAFVAVFVAAVAVAVAVAPLPRAAPVFTQATCGKERWAVKTLTDTTDADKVNFTAKSTTVEKLRKLKVPAGFSEFSPRFIPQETATYKVKALLMSVKLEKDSDLHLVIADPRVGGSMIVEFPAAGCIGARAHGKMVNARAALKDACGGAPAKVGALWTLRGTATLSGVAFFDKLHRQGGLAPNGIELHPVLSFQSSDCTVTVK